MKKIDNCENSTVLVGLLLAGILLVMGGYRIFSYLCDRGAVDTATYLLGAAALVLAILAIASGYFLPVLVGAVLGIAAVIAGFASLMFGKGGLLPALVGIAAGFLNLLAAIVVSKMQ